MRARHMASMPQHDPIPRRDLERTAIAWTRYKRLMRWMALAAATCAILALAWLKSTGSPLPIHMVIATIAGVGFSVLLGTGLMGLVYFSNNSGHDDAATTRKNEDDV
ncbi:hypothetical protein SAMN06295910_0829 [Allosphingosinicella indica]|uniref:Uncharacterized protein n=2 Tax=Allosphingosinicella indica TaxID=941907 RepID=A0A1X7G0I5_9SPHN|nr:hypothetical protein SAMN06295910_0829 [Allosphingosinicella indica]